MARVTAGDRSSLSGKADGLVYVQFNGEVYTRKLPKRKKEAWTPGMLKNLQRFKLVNQFCAKFKDEVIPQIWNGVDKKMSGYALFLKSNMPAFAPDGSLKDAVKIRLSTGMLSWPEGLEAHRSVENENRIEVSWPKEMHVGGAHLQDELMVISCRDGQYSHITPTGISKADLKGKFELPSTPLFTGTQYLYLFFASKDHRDYSDSFCIEI